MTHIEISVSGCNPQRPRFAMEPSLTPLPAHQRTEWRDLLPAALFPSAHALHTGDLLALDPLTRNLPYDEHLHQSQFYFSLMQYPHAAGGYRWKAEETKTDVDA